MGSDNENTFYFQETSQDNCAVWCTRGDNMLVDLFVRNGRIFQIDVNGVELVVTPLCELACDGPNDRECQCFFTDQIDAACPFGRAEDESTSSAVYLVDLPFADISSEDIERTIRETVRPEFGAPASLLDVLSFTWVLMDPVLGVRTILQGGQVERPKIEEI